MVFSRVGVVTVTDLVRSSATYLLTDKLCVPTVKGNEQKKTHTRTWNNRATTTNQWVVAKKKMKTIRVKQNKTALFLTGPQ